MTSPNLVVEVLSCTYEEKLPTFGGLSVTVEPHSRLNSSRSVVRSADLRGTSEDEIVEELDEVTHARRITRHRNENRIETDSIILSFDSPTPPRKIKMGYLNLDVRPYIPNPMRCFKCHRFGHGKDHCKRPDALCVRCGNGGHLEHDCSNDPSCINCRGDHSAISFTCPKYLEEQAILRYNKQRRPS